MSVPTTDGWSLLLAACVAVLLAHTMLTLARQVSTAGRRGCARAVLSCALVLGFGLWATNFVEVLAFWVADQPSVGLSWLLLPYAVAVSSLACALLFIARRKPDTSSLAGCAFALAMGVAATRCAALDELPGQLMLDEGVIWIWTSFLLSFALFLAALRIWFGLESRSWRAAALRLVATLAGTLAILVVNARLLADSNPVFGACCSAPAGAARLFAVNAAALGCAVLVTARVIAMARRTPDERARRTPDEWARRTPKDSSNIPSGDRRSNAHDGRGCEGLLAKAATAMTLAKERGGGQVLLFQPGMSSMAQTLAPDIDLCRGLAARELELQYQPQISTKTGRISATEALPCWRHPTQGLIGPRALLSLAEETGLMIPLGEWMLGEACRQARAWRRDLGAAFPVAVNLSARQFRHQNVLSMIAAALTDAELDGTALEIEVTESTLMIDPEESVRVLKLLRRLDVSVAIDDFGTGYSSLSHLRRFPIDKLKIDRSFIRDLAVSHTDESIVRAIVSVARSVGLKVVAEGIDSAAQLELVTRIECDHWQGRHCCAPQSAAQFAALIAAGKESRMRLVETYAEFGVDGGVQSCGVES
jgi:EAL domain-containing protein (putative c-di-GMP-specific phosphodiesterase class I)/NO-binding membrane sensor protein with MHYT domain